MQQSSALLVSLPRKPFVVSRHWYSYKYLALLADAISRKPFSVAGSSEQCIILDSLFYLYRITVKLKSLRLPLLILDTLLFLLVNILALIENSPCSLLSSANRKPSLRGDCIEKCARWSGLLLCP